MSFLDDVGNFFAKDVPKFMSDNKELISASVGIFTGGVGGAVAAAALQHVAAGAIVNDAVDKASKGDATAKAQLQNVAAKAAAGDPSAQAAHDAAQKIAAAKVNTVAAPKSNTLPLLAGAGALAGLLAAIL
jgi:hypothetical protein